MIKPAITTLPFTDFCLELDKYVGPRIDNKITVDKNILYIKKGIFLKHISEIDLIEILSAFKFEITMDISEILFLKYTDEILYIKPKSKNGYKTKVPKYISWSQI